MAQDRKAENIKENWTYPLEATGEEAARCALRCGGTYADLARLRFAKESWISGGRRLRE